MTKPTVVDRPELPETYSDTVLSVAIAHGLARIELAVLRPHPIDGEPKRAISCARLLMPPLATAKLADLLAQAVQAFEKDKLLRRAPNDMTTQQ